MLPESATTWRASQKRRRCSPRCWKRSSRVAEHTAALSDIDEHTTHVERMLPALVELERSLPELTPRSRS